MALIVRRDFSDGLTKGISLGVITTASLDTQIHRTLEFSSSWTCLRIGVLFALNESRSFDKNFGLAMGVSSGSEGIFLRKPSIKWTHICSGIGRVLGVLGYAVTPCSYITSSVGSGSCYRPSLHGTWGFQNGGTTENNGAAGNVIYVPTLEDASKRRRGLMVTQFSASATGYRVSIWGVGPAISSSGNRDFTAGDLKAVLTASSTTAVPHVAGFGLSEIEWDTAFANKSTYPLDTVFLSYVGGVPIEIYDWYIYKVA